MATMRCMCANVVGFVLLLGPYYITLFFNMLGFFPPNALSKGYRD